MIGYRSGFEHNAHRGTTGGRESRRRQALRDKSLRKLVALGFS